MKMIISSKMISIRWYGISILIFLAMIFSSTLFPAGFEMSYCVLILYILMPLITLIISFIISIKKGYLFWLYPVFAGVCGIIVPFSVFHTFDWIGVMFTLPSSLIGLIIGLVISLIRKI